MTVYIGECPLGIFAFDDQLNLIESEPFSNDTREIASKMYKVQENEPTEEHFKLLEKLSKDDSEKFSIESKQIASELEKRFEEANFEVKIPNPANEKLRATMREIGKDLDFENVHQLIRDVNILMTRKALRREASERDKIIIETIDIIDELDETINSLYGRIVEWYGIHFPELERYISENSKYLQLISELGNRKNFSKEELIDLDIPEEKAAKIEKDSNDSIGAEFDEKDIGAIQENVEKVRGLEESRKETTDYLNGLMEQVAPNIKTLVGGPLGARLISLAGGLKELAKKPSSTIQVLGAEKALFRSLNEGAKPPKHGIIFQYPDIRGAPEHKRGKIARALAGKITIAARVDSMSGQFVGDKLNEELKNRIDSIKEE